MTDKKTDTSTPLIVTPNGTHELTSDALVVLGVFANDHNRAMAVDEVETILAANPDPLCWGLKVRESFKELETAKMIRECPLEMHNDGDSRYRLV